MKKNDSILLAIFLVAGLLLFGIFRLNRPAGYTVVVRVDEEETASYNLNDNLTVEIEGVNGGTNQLVIENGKAYLSHASCPDQLCVHQGTVDKQGQSIICLPNKVIIEIQGETENEEEGYDAIAY
jgi:hypothetical protein